jgi:hypothetical protein
MFWAFHHMKIVQMLPLAIFCHTVYADIYISVLEMALISRTDVAATITGGASGGALRLYHNGFPILLHDFVTTSKLLIDMC